MFLRALLGDVGENDTALLRLLLDFGEQLII